MQSTNPHNSFRSELKAQIQGKTKTSSSVPNIVYSNAYARVKEKDASGGKKARNQVIKEVLSAVGKHGSLDALRRALEEGSFTFTSGGSGPQSKRHKKVPVT